MNVMDVCQYYNDLGQKLDQPKGDPNQQQLLIPLSKTAEPIFRAKQFLPQQMAQKKWSIT